MKPPSEIGEVVASRLFDRADGQVELSIHRPAPDPDPALDADPDDPPWRCWYTIRFPDGEVCQRRVMGIDSMHALLLAFSAASVELRYGPKPGVRRPELVWNGESDLGLTINHFE